MSPDKQSYRNILVFHILMGSFSDSFVSLLCTFFSLQVNITLKKAGSKMEHQGIKIEFIGQIGMYIFMVSDY